MGGDKRFLEDLSLMCVSIHAPAWGATQTMYKGFELLEFQSTPPHGGDFFSLEIKYNVLRFQSTPPHGGDIVHHGLFLLFVVSIHAPAWRRRSAEDILLSELAFQSTPPHGGDVVYHKRRFALFVSIHAPAWGATIASQESALGKSTFQSTPPHGGRRNLRK